MQYHIYKRLEGRRNTKKNIIISEHIYLHIKGTLYIYYIFLHYYIALLLSI